MPFTFHTDPGHGWLEVSVAALAAVGLAANAFSTYSYISRDRATLYLEEDCDAPIFIAAFCAKHGNPPVIAERYAHNTFVRNLPRIG